MRKAVGFPHHGGVVKGARKPPATQCTDEPGEFQRSLHVAPLMPEGANFPARMVDFQYDQRTQYAACTHHRRYTLLADHIESVAVYHSKFLRTVSVKIASKCLNMF